MLTLWMTQHKWTGYNDSTVNRNPVYGHHSGQKHSVIAAIPPPAFSFLRRGKLQMEYLHCADFISSTTLVPSFFVRSLCQPPYAALMKP